MSVIKGKARKVAKTFCKVFLRKLLSKDFVCRKNYEAFIKQRKLYERMEKGNLLDLLKVVHIETRTRCNSLCSFCAANSRFERRRDRCMSEDTYKRIIDSLAEMKYRRRVSPYCNNEPLLDDNIYSYIAYTRERLPESFVELKTNGTVLDEERLKQLFDNGLDTLYVNDYQISSHVTQKLKELYDKYKDLYYGKFFLFQKSFFQGRMVGRTVRVVILPNLHYQNPKIFLLSSF